MFNIGHPSESFLEASTVPDVNPSLAGCRGRSGSSGEGPAGERGSGQQLFPNLCGGLRYFNTWAAMLV